MKSRVLSILIALLSVFPMFAQEAVEVTETVESINNTSGSALNTNVFRASEKDIIKEWKSIMKGYDGDVKTKGNEVHATEVLIESISSSPIEVFFKVKEISETKHEVFVQFKNEGDFISTGTDISGYTAAEGILNSYATKLSQEASEAYFEEQEKELKSLESNLEKLAREKKKAEKDIEDCKESIKDNEYKLEENKKNQTSTVKQIEEQKKKVRNAKKEKDIFK